MTFEELDKALWDIAFDEFPTIKMWFRHRPDRWWEDPTWRCVNEHVSTFYLKSESLGGARCLACREPISLTFPEDKEGPLVAPRVKAE